jgi:hypothetical protein
MTNLLPLLTIAFVTALVALVLSRGLRRALDA